MILLGLSTLSKKSIFCRKFRHKIEKVPTKNTKSFDIKLKKFRHKTQKVPTKDVSKKSSDKKHKKKVRKKVLTKNTGPEILGQAVFLE